MCDGQLHLLSKGSKNSTVISLYCLYNMTQLNDGSVAKIFFLLMTEVFVLYPIFVVSVNNR